MQFSTANPPWMSDAGLGHGDGLLRNGWDGIHDDCDPEECLDFYDPFGAPFSYGWTGHQPYRLGWYSYQDVVILPRATAHTAGGNFQATEWNGWLRYSTLVQPDVLFAWTGVWNTWFLSGPGDIPFSSDINQVRSDFQVSSVYGGPWNWQVGLTPQVNSDFHGSVNGQAFMLDARAAVTYQLNRTLQLVAGAAVWDRTVVYGIPYGGVVWSPADAWELRLMFPRSRISYYLGQIGGADAWAYAAAEYNINAFQMHMEQIGVTDRMEFRDYRLFLGFNAARGKWSAFVQSGVITDRHVGFQGSTPGFSIGDTWLLQAGLWY